MISVIVPLYNKESIIERSLNSVLSQDYNDYELIVVDDGSTDNSVEIIRAIQDPRIQLISQENGGPSSARNTGVKHAEGDWIMFLDADDELLPGALNHFAKLIRENHNTQLFCCTFYSSKNGERRLVYKYQDRKITNNFKEHFFGKFLSRTGACIYAAELARSYPFNETIRRFEDLEVLFRLYNGTDIILSSTPVLIVNLDYAAASRGRKDIKEDLLGHLNFKGKSFWERMCLYQLFLSERAHYPEQCRKLYPQLYHRWDYYLMYQFLTRTKKLWI